MRTLDEIYQLKQTRFGQPQPRHGLKLLHWFAKDCLTVDQNNAFHLRCYPGNGDFGFHPFQNRYERNGQKLLPDVTFPYYELGNLSKTAASNLPFNVREYYESYNKMSNKDRIIVGINNKWFQTLFVTEHIDRSNFNKHATYQISRRLIMIIRGLSLDDFLRRTGYSTVQADSFYTINVNTQSNTSSSTSTQSTYTSATGTSRNQDTRVIIDDTDESIFDALSRCNCTIL
ncbi:uncharacterized protein LOC113642537 [Tachysurus fulvidraco]|uniref:uncharacterized protein LOC113642537 n=1 Tax=Tachysurus fulvidraco TaxID=1234273 RepID=UPI000F4D30C4|nr:uncharacterized protein LOC113642537 [Tachysurus fulvidraco]XP_027001899.1 uncharacterized protein LOC113642537 [Tachysurus fulvidraco]